MMSDASIKKVGEARAKRIQYLIKQYDLGNLKPHQKDELIDLLVETYVNF